MREPGRAKHAGPPTRHARRTAHAGPGTLDRDASTWEERPERCKPEGVAADARHTKRRSALRIVVTGATGTIGRALLATLDGEVTVLTRTPDRARALVNAARHVAWDGRSALDPGTFDGVDLVYHLAGEPVASRRRWSREKKRRIEDSRVLGTRAVVDAIGKARARPALVCASAIGFYGDRGDELLTESTGPGDGFLADVCRKWEAEAAAAERHGVRVARMRIGLVLSREGGALRRILPLFRAGLAGRLGSGRQWMPWIHIDDVVALLRHAGLHPDLVGPVNTVAPHAVTNATFTRALGRVLHRPTLLAVPTFALRLARGELAEVVLASQHAVPEAATRAGFVFRHTRIDGALEDLVRRSASAEPTGGGRRAEAT